MCNPGTCPVTGRGRKKGHAGLPGAGCGNLGAWLTWLIINVNPNSKIQTYIGRRVFNEPPATGEGENEKEGNARLQGRWMRQPWTMSDVAD